MVENKIKKHYINNIFITFMLRKLGQQREREQEKQGQQKLEAGAE